MSYNAVRRGPMGGDQYTQIHNGVFRDTRLTPQAMAVFGHVSTHDQGWQTSSAGIARSMGLAESTVSKALRCLKDYHYVIYGQDRRPDGTVEGGWYFITDLPAQLAAAGVTDDATIANSVTMALATWLEENGSSGPVSSLGIPALTSHYRRPRAV